MTDELKHTITYAIQSGRLAARQVAGELASLASFEEHQGSCVRLFKGVFLSVWVAGKEDKTASRLCSCLPLASRN